MARKKFKEGFKEEVLLYHATHTDETIKACAAKFDIGYSTLRRWIAENEDSNKAIAVDKENENGKASCSEDTLTAESVHHVNQENESKTISELEKEENPNVMDEALAVEAEHGNLDNDVEVFYIDPGDIEDENQITQMDVLKHELKGMASSVKHAVVGAMELVQLYKRRYYLCKVRNTLESETRKRYHQARISEGE